jgi:hypothetical protein
VIVNECVNVTGEDNAALKISKSRAKERMLMLLIILNGTKFSAAYERPLNLSYL